MQIIAPSNILPCNVHLPQAMVSLFSNTSAKTKLSDITYSTTSSNITKSTTAFSKEGSKRTAALASK
jgi:hypothetical protein